MTKPKLRPDALPVVYVTKTRALVMAEVTSKAVTVAMAAVVVFPVSQSSIVFRAAVEKAAITAYSLMAKGYVVFSQHGAPLGYF